MCFSAWVYVPWPVCYNTGMYSELNVVVSVPRLSKAFYDVSKTNRDVSDSGVQDTYMSRVVGYVTTTPGAVSGLFP